MDQANIVDTVERAIQSTAARPTVPLPDTQLQLWSQIMQSQIPGIEPTAKQALLGAIRAEQELRLFDNQQQQRLDSSHPVSLGDLADWLVLRGQQVGSVQAVQTPPA